MAHRLRASVLEYTKCGLLTEVGIHLYRAGDDIIHPGMGFFQSCDCLKITNTPVSKTNKSLGSLTYTWVE